MLVREIALYLHGKAIGRFDEEGTSGNIFVMQYPADPDVCLSLSPTGGYPTPSSLGYDLPTVQIIVRGDKDPRTAEQMAQRVHSAFENFHGTFAPGGTLINLCEAMGPPKWIGCDQNGRHEYTLNLRLDVENKTDHRE